MPDHTGPDPTSLAAALRERVLICDGAMGTMLHAAGNSLDRALPELNLSNPGLVSTIHESYLGAGADMILTNTFGASKLRLAAQGYGDLVREINLAGARLARQARESAGRPVFVAGSVSPAVIASQRRRFTPQQRAAALREQIEALTAGGVDVLVLETFGYLEELIEAVTVASEASGLPVIAQATFAVDERTLGGESPREVARALSSLPVTAIGTNCTLGPHGALAVVRAMVPHTTLPVSAQPNAGLPRRVAGRRFEYNVDGAYFARFARRLAEAGAALVGGCCGTTPTQIQAAAAEIAGTVPRPPRTRDPEPSAPPLTLAGPDAGLAERLAAGFLVAAGIAPPLGGGADEAADHAVTLAERGIEVFFIASRQSPRAQLSSIDLAFHLQQRVRAETIATVTTWDKTIMTLQADLLGANALGLRNIVCETGNPPLLGDYPNTDGIWDVDSIGLAELVAGLNEGVDCNGLELAAKTSLYPGARFNPSAADPEAEIARTEAKISAGAQFLITRPVYEPEPLRRMVSALSADVPILVCVAPLRSFEEADYLSHEVPDIGISGHTLAAMERAGPDQERTGLELAASLLAQARPLVRGAVLTLPGASPAALDLLLDALS
ncbi:MAG TPA: bifunctional homocysteine S-methyltransferase/methylenetetrahydrofolate reductase [Streptosporangiaceae bacterium]